MKLGTAVSGFLTIVYLSLKWLSKAYLATFTYLVSFKLVANLFLFWIYQACFPVSNHASHLFSHHG